MTEISSAQVFGLLLTFDAGAREVLPASIELSDKAACEIAEVVLRFWCGDEVRKEVGARRFRLAVAISDALVEFGVFDNIGMESVLGRVAQRVARALDEPNGTPLDGVVLLKKFATRTPASQRHAVRGEYPVRGTVRRLPGLLEAVGYFEPQTSAPADQEEGADGDVVEMVLPIVFAGDDGFVEQASTVMDELPSQEDAQKIQKVLARELKQQGLPYQFDVDVCPYRLDLPLDWEDEDEDEDVPGLGITSENMTFHEQQARQNYIPSVVEALRKLGQDETLVAITAALQSLSREQSRPLVTVMDDVCAVVTPDVVYVGFKTVDDVIASAQAEEEDSRHGCSGDELLDYWRDWISKRYYPLLESLQANDFKTRSFHLPTWNKVMGSSLGEDRVVVGLAPESGAYPILADLFVEKSRHVNETDMQPQMLCVAEQVVQIEGPASDKGEEFFGIAVQCALTAAGEVAWQNNVFATRPLAASWCDDFLDTLQQDSGIGKKVDGRLLVCEACMLLAVEPVFAEIHDRVKLGKAAGHKLH
jgi:hypothetical protein